MNLFTSLNRFASLNRMVAVVALVVATLVMALSLAFTSVDRDVLAEVMPATEAPALEQDAPEFATAAVTDDALWLARVIYSETKRPDEQELVAWVVRNRVETAYRGKNTYQGVVLDPWQFSAFNRNAPKRVHYTGLTTNCAPAGWQTALQIAQAVVEAPAYERPFATDTRHFYSERSMVGRSAPDWAIGKRPVSLDREVDPRRFRFYRAIA
jgi:hypothetical protein